MAESQGRAPENRAWLWPLALAGLLLAIAAARILLLQDVYFTQDESWSVWQGFGSWSNVIRWTPFDWPPLYYLTLDFWVEVVGLQPLALRLLSVFSFLIGAACFYLILKRHGGAAAAFMGLLIYGGMSYTVYIGIAVRGYSLMLLLILLAWLIAQRMLRRPRWWHAVCFAFLVSAAVYTSYTGAIPTALLFLYILWMAGNRRGRIAKYWTIASLFTLLLVIPLAIFIFPIVSVRTEANLQTIDLLPFHEAMARFYMHAFNQGAWIIVILELIGMGVLLSQRKISRSQAFFLLWGVISLPVLYLLNPILNFFSVAYINWVYIGIAGFIALTVCSLPRWARRVTLGVSCVLLLQPIFQPTPITRYFRWGGRWLLAHQISSNFDWLRGEIQGGDHVLLAEDQECKTHPNLWNHSLLFYFPKGLNFIDTPVDHQRVWFVTADGSPGSPHWETLRRDYVERQFVGPPGCLFRLYEGPPDQEGILFANGLRFHGAQFLQESEPLPPGFSPQLHEGEAFRMRFWWRVDEPLPRDYSVGAFLFDGEGHVIQEVHGPPDPTYPGDAPWETSRWQAGQIYYEDREFEAPYPLARQELELRLVVYYWEEPAQRFAAPGTDTLGMLPVMRIYVYSW